MLNDQVGCLVTMGQRPETAKGTLFVTLEDETGVTNVIVWPGLLELLGGLTVESRNFH